MSDVDVAKAPRGERAARALVDVIVAGDDRVERHYLEVKSGLDLTTKKDQAKLAKFILGAANRLPDKAVTAFEGYGVMVIGASSNALVGVPPIEVLDIEKAVQPFIGADGPRWDVVRVALPDSGNEVLLLLVDPPEWGQQPFVCLKDGDEKLRNGAVFVRADGETREAKGDELKELLRRGATSAKAAVNFRVHVTREVTPVKFDAQGVLEEYIEKESARLHSALERTRRSSSGGQSTNGGPGNGGMGPISSAMSSIAAMMTQPESRTEDVYLAAVEAWVKDIRERWNSAALHLIAGLLPKAQIKVINGEKTYFHDVEVKMHIEGDVHGQEWWKASDEITRGDLELPGPPRAWGPKAVDVLGSQFMTPAYVPYLGGLSALPKRTNWHNAGSVDLSFSVGELRPKEIDISDDLDLVLFTTDTSATGFRAEWEITARDHNEIFSGELMLQVGEVLDLTPHFRAILGLEEVDA